MSNNVRNVENLLNRCEACDSERKEGEGERGVASLGGENAKVRQEGVERKAVNPRGKKIKTHTKRVLSDPIYSKIPNDMVQIEALVASDVRYMEQWAFRGGMCW